MYGHCGMDKIVVVLNVPAVVLQGASSVNY